MRMLKAAEKDNLNTAPAAIGDRMMHVMYDYIECTQSRRLWNAAAQAACL